MSARPGPPYCYDYPRPALTVDLAVFRRVEDRWQILLIQRKHDPFAGRWALPGGFVDENEPLDQAARRELLEETGLSDVPLRQFGAFGDPGRDPRGWTVTVAYLAVLARQTTAFKAGDDAARAAWFDVGHLPPLAFDHDRIVAGAVSLLEEHPG